MEQKFGFTKMTMQEFEPWIAQMRIARTILKIQQHHTYSPAYIHFKTDNHFALQKGMKNYHVTHNGWNNIGQHFTTFPDGTIMTGRSLEASPACIYGNNAHSICMEHLGNFDTGGDQMTAQQRETILKMTAALCKKFNLEVTVQSIVYHHWFNLSTGERNNGRKNNKSCPGTNFFGGNKVNDCEDHFLPEVKAMLNPLVTTSINTLRFVCVDADSLNIRIGPAASYSLAPEREPLQAGAILRVYDESNGWIRISSSAAHWVNGKFTRNVVRTTVNASLLNVRSGPSAEFPKVASLPKGSEVFISDEQNGWCKISMDNRWVKKSYLVA